MFDVVIIYTLDRLYRPREEGEEWRMLELVDRFKKLGVSIEFVTGGIPTEGPFASMFSMFESWRAGEERRKLIERTQRGRKERIAEVDRRLVEIDRARIKGRIPVEELDRGEREEMNIRSDLMHRLDAYDPAEIEELECAREILRNAGALSTWASQYGRYQKVDLGGIKGYVPYGELPVDREVAMLFAVGMPEWFRASPENPLCETEARRAFVDLLDRSHAEHPSKLEIRGAVPVEVTMGDDDPLLAPTVRRELEGGPNRHTEIHEISRPVTSLTTARNSRWLRSPLNASSSNTSACNDLRAR